MRRHLKVKRDSSQIRKLGSLLKVALKHIGDLRETKSNAVQGPVN